MGSHSMEIVDGIYLIFVLIGAAQRVISHKKNKAGRILGKFIDYWASFQWKTGF